MFHSLRRLGSLFLSKRLPRCGSSNRMNSGGSGISAGRPGPLFGGPRPLLFAAVTSGTLSLLGDTLAQGIQLTTQGADIQTLINSHDASRAARMASFGLVLYGPLQHFWYAILGWQFPLKSTAHFLWKVTLNQAVLGPIVCTIAFSWTLLLTGKIAELGKKISSDFVPTLVTGWKFWVPAACINFYCIPLPYQVLFMSCCATVWTGYLSYASHSERAEHAQ